MRTPGALAALALVVPFAAPLTGGPVSADSLYALKTTTLQGEPAELSMYAGKVALVVNTASQCGFTPQYAGLEKLYADYKDKGLVVLGFPSNDFGGQEPGTAEEIAAFCRKNYGVTFPMFSKVVTREGADQSPIYAYLGKSGTLPGWNFGKYLLDKEGRVIRFFDSKVKPESDELRGAIDAALAD